MANGRNGKKYTTEEMIKAIQLNKGMIYRIAKSLNCSPQTIYNYAKNTKAIQTAIDNERGIFLDNTELKLEDAVQNGEGWAIAFTLKTIGKKRGYTEKTEIDQRTINIEVDLSALTDDQLKRLASGENIANILSDK